MPITVIARAKARPEQTEALEKELQTVVQLTRQEKGCLQYGLYRSPDDPTTILTIEKWATPEALGAHYNQPYVKTLFERIPNLVAAPPEILTLEEISVN